MKKRTLTPFGLEVKKRLLETGITQKAFCERHDIGETRFCEVIYGVMPGYKHKEKIAKALKINVPDDIFFVNHAPPMNSYKLMCMSIKGVHSKREGGTTKRAIPGK